MSKNVLSWDWRATCSAQREYFGPFFTWGSLSGKNGTKKCYHPKYSPYFSFSPLKKVSVREAGWPDYFFKSHDRARGVATAPHAGPHPHGARFARRAVSPGRTKSVSERNRGHAN